MRAQELRQKTAAELNSLLMDLHREQFSLRMQQGTGQAVARPSQVRQVRRDIARIKTIMHEQRLKGGKT
ncbi:MAG TPA: 50S ribosomal protein L29 [Gammaproteobacteria bacterium]|nr:50S ribosomal protein L29 [Gammaproteobacteria bacterium]